jgi:alanyl-tRNA synthetase
VEPGRLRFDFTHYAALDAEEIRQVEHLMNEHVLQNQAVSTDVMDLDQALTTGAMALFGEKYGDKVRVVSIPNFSRELCGGTHVQRTGDIGFCKVVYEGSISAGVRRIEAITGEAALERFQHTVRLVQELAGKLRSNEADIGEQLEKLLAQLERDNERLKNKLAHSHAADLEQSARELKGVKVLATRVDMDRAQMRALADSLRNKWKSAVVVLAAPEDSGIAILSAVTKDLSGRVHAGKLVGSVAQQVGGKGGGRPDMAEGGGKDLSALPQALQGVYTAVEGML